MPQTCKACTHPNRTEIDRALLAGSSSLRDIARQFGISKDVLHRHRSTHLRARMAEVAKERADADVRTALDVVDQLRAINGASMRVLKEARDQGELGLMLRAIDRIAKQIELQARLLGDLPARVEISGPDGVPLNAPAPSWVAYLTRDELRTMARIQRIGIDRMEGCTVGETHDVNRPVVLPLPETS